MNNSSFLPATADIILVDDTIESLRLLRDLLSSQEYNVRPATNGKDALVAIQHRKPDLILLDIRMPGMDGFEVCRRLQADSETRDIPIIFVTASVDPEGAAKGLSLGAVDYITKPIRKNEVLARVRTHVELYRMRRLLAEKSEEKEEQYTQLVEAIQDYYFFYSHDTEGVFTYLSPSVDTILGYKQEEFLVHYNEYLTDNPINREVERLSALAIQGEEQPPYDVEIFAKDGTVHWLEVKEKPIFDDHGAVIAVNGIAHDVTDRKKMENELLDREETLRCITTSAQDGIIMLDNDGKIMFWNQSACHIFGYTEEEALGKDGHMLLVPEDTHDIYSEGFSRFRQTGEGAVIGKTLETKAMHKDGSRIPIELSISAARLHNVWCAVALVRDISERKRAEWEKEVLEAEIRKTQKMEAIATLAGGIAHDFNNILAGIMGFNQLARELEKDPKVQEFLLEVHKTSLRARDLVAQILTFSREEEQENSPVQLKPILKEVMKLLKASIPSEITIKADILSDSVVFTDPIKMHQVVMNLCTNAYQALKEAGGKLHVTLEDITLDEGRSSTLSHLQPGAYVRLTIADTGPGIAPDIVDKIFDPFFTTKQDNKGTGLGLSVVHGIVTASKGDIVVETEVGKGTMFHVLLPTVDAKDEEAAVSSKLHFGSGHILFVDDEDYLLRIGKEMLGRLGYEVVTCDSALGALEELQGSRNVFDLALIDIAMPGMNGIDLARKILAGQPDMKIIFHTGFLDRITHEEAQKMGVKTIVKKPWTMQEISRVVEQVLLGNGQE